MVVLLAPAQRLVGCAVAWMVIGCIAVSLRLLAKRRTKAAFALDDGWCILALALMIAFNAVQIAALILAGGTLVKTDMTIHHLTGYLRTLYIANLLWPASITAAKISILFFYRRIFTTRKFRNASLCVDALCWMWMLIHTFVLAFQCNPVPAAWDPKRLAASHRCHALGTLVLGPEITNIFVDILILALPIHMIRGLQMHRRQKILVSLVFLFGGLVCITGVARIVVLYHPDDKHFDIAGGIIVDSVENGFALVCACLPICRPLLPKEIPLLNTMTDWLQSIYTGSVLKFGRQPRGSVPDYGFGNVHSKQKASRYNQFDSGMQDSVHLASVENTVHKTGGFALGKEFPMDRIAVQKTVDVV